MTGIAVILLPTLPQSAPVMSMDSISIYNASEILSIASLVIETILWNRSTSCSYWLIGDAAETFLEQTGVVVENIAETGATLIERVKPLLNSLLWRPQLRTNRGGNR